MSEVVIFRSMNAHQVLIFIVVGTRIVCCVADSLQERSFASIGTTDYKNTKASIFCSEIIGFAVDHGPMVVVVRVLRGNTAVES